MWCIIKRSLLYILLFFTCSCIKPPQGESEELTISSQNPYDTASQIYNTYKYYVRALDVSEFKLGNIQLKRLSSQISPIKEYYTEEEVKNYYLNNPPSNTQKRNGVSENYTHIIDSLSVSRSTGKHRVTLGIGGLTFEPNEPGDSSELNTKNKAQEAYLTYYYYSPNNSNFSIFGRMENDYFGNKNNNNTWKINDYYSWKKDDYFSWKRGDEVLDRILYQIVQDLFKNGEELGAVGGTTRELVFSSKFNQTVSDSNSLKVNNFLNSLITNALEDMVSLLDDLLDEEQKKEVKKVKLSFGTLSTNSSSQLWIKTDGKYIYISPYLIRAAYVYAISNNFKEFFKIYWSGLNEWALNSWMQLETGEIASINRLILQDFTNAFYFVLSHELAHTYYSRPTTGNVKDEIVCDCGAYNALKKRANNVELGVFKTILLESVKSNMYEVWGNKNPTQINLRLRYLNDLEMGIINPDCNNIPKMYLSEN